MRRQLALLCQGMEEITLGDREISAEDLEDVRERAIEVLEIVERLRESANS